MLEVATMVSTKRLCFEAYTHSKPISALISLIGGRTVMKTWRGDGPPEESLHGGFEYRDGGSIPLEARFRHGANL